MARTKADSYTKAAVKAPRKASALTGGQAPNVKAGSKAAKTGGNPYCPRPTPSWQKPITTFFYKEESLGESSNSQAKDKKPEETIVSSNDEKNVEKAGTSKDVNEMDQEEFDNDKDGEESGIDEDVEESGNDKDGEYSGNDKDGEKSGNKEGEKSGDELNYDEPGPSGLMKGDVDDDFVEIDDDDE